MVWLCKTNVQDRIFCLMFLLLSLSWTEFFIYFLPWTICCNYLVTTFRWFCSLSSEEGIHPKSKPSIPLCTADWFSLPPGKNPAPPAPPALFRASSSCWDEKTSRLKTIVGADVHNDFLSFLLTKRGNLNPQTPRPVVSKWDLQGPQRSMEMSESNSPSELVRVPL